MLIQQIMIVTMLIVMFFLFVWGKWRYDLVAFSGLILVAVFGIVPIEKVYSGFSHPAVITVIAVLIISKALENSGLVNILAKPLIKKRYGNLLVLAFLTSLATLLSAFMNNVGALGLLMPVALYIASRTKVSPSILLMPIAFASILGGLITSIGTPPNLIIASYRKSVTGTEFGLFDFFPVGIVIALTGLIFIVAVGWRFLPIGRNPDQKSSQLFEINDYLFETRIRDTSPLVGQSASLLEGYNGINVDLSAILRERQWITGRKNYQRFTLQKDDLLILETTPAELNVMLEEAGLELLSDISDDNSSDTSEMKIQDISVIEVVIAPGSKLEGKAARDIQLRSTYGFAIVGILRQGKPFKKRLHHIKLNAGDIILLRGERDSMTKYASELGFLTLESRGIHFTDRTKSFLALTVFFAGVGLATLKILPISIALMCSVLAMIFMGVIKLKDAYNAVDWPVIILLGSMIPIGYAMQATQTTDLIANNLLTFTGDSSPVLLLIITMLLTVILTNLLNNTATAVIMAPISISIAQSMSVNIDPFLMAVAISSSCAFLTPIGHQNNILVMGPGGYRFGDFWRMGLPLQIVIFVVSVPALLIFWPLQ